MVRHGNIGSAIDGFGVSANFAQDVQLSASRQLPCIRICTTATQLSVALLGRAVYRAAMLTAEPAD